jgi:hypothetical protein
MSDPLEDLANRLRKGEWPASPAGRPQQRPTRPVQQAVAPSSFLKSAGPGGLVFDFGDATGNPIADNFTTILNRFCDPTQESIVRMQRQQFAKAQADYVASGVQPEEGGEGAQAAWNTQLSKSFDEQTAEAIRKGEIPVAPGVPGESSRPAPGRVVKGNFNETTMQLGGEQLVAQSETDAAVIEMMKSMQDQPDDGEFVIDETAEGI